jgi:hypothetical protein
VHLHQVLGAAILAERAPGEAARKQPPSYQA